MEKESISRGRESRIGSDFGQSWRSDIVKSYPNPSFFPLGYEKDILNQGIDNAYFFGNKRNCLICC